MASEELGKDFSELHVTKNSDCDGRSNALEDQAVHGDVQITCFTEDLHDATIHFQIIRLVKQIYLWIGCNTAKLGHLYAAAITRPNGTVSVTPVLGGASDTTGSSIARRLALKTGLNIIVACNIPKDSPMLEASTGRNFCSGGMHAFMFDTSCLTDVMAKAERKLIQKLKSLGYIRPRLQMTPMASA